MEEQGIFEYITTQKNKFATDRVPLTNSKSWNFKEHIERCTNVSNGWFHSGQNDGLRPYDDIVTPIVNVAFRSEGFDVKDIVPFVNDKVNYYKSFIVKKFHPQWARKYLLDTFIDDVVETSIIYDLVLVKDINEVRPEVVDLKTLAFCDQTDVMAGPICIEHGYTISDLNSFRGKWDDDAIDMVISQAKNTKNVPTAGDQKVEKPSKNIECFELSGYLPKRWLDPEAGEFEYQDSLFIVAYYTDTSGKKQGITLYKGKDKPMSDKFKALKIDRIRSKGRACGRSIVETLFEPQVWNNYSGIKIKQLLDAAITVWQSDSDELAGQKLDSLKLNTVLKHETGKPITKVDGQIQNLQAFTAHQAKMQNDARILGSATDPQLGVSPTSGTPFALQNLVVQQGQNMHEFRQGKISTFFADVLYPDLILKYLVEDINKGKEFSEELSLDEMLEIKDAIATHKYNEQIIQMILDGHQFQDGEAEQMLEQEKQKFMASGNRQFFAEFKAMLKDIPVDVFVNIKGKQKDLAGLADKLTNLLREASKNPQGASMFATQYNELLEASGLSPIDFTSMTKAQPQQTAPSPSGLPTAPQPQLA